MTDCLDNTDVLKTGPHSGGAFVRGIGATALPNRIVQIALRFSF